MSGVPTLSLPEFEGPLDLLLALIERGRLPITCVSLAAVADQYLAAVRAMPAPDPELLVRFLVVAGRLLVIKSRALLPAPESDDAVEEDGAEALERRLAEYALIRAAAQRLGELEERGWRAYPPAARPLPERSVPLKGQLDPAVLVGVLRRIAPPAASRAAEAFGRARARVEDRLAGLRAALAARGKVVLESEALGGTVDEVIATLLAALELVRWGEAEIGQREAFGPIHLWRRERAE